MRFPSPAIVVCIFGAMVFVILYLLSTSIRIVREETRLSVYRLGRYIGDKGPGLVFLLPIIDLGVVKELGSIEKTPTPNPGMTGMIGETRTTVYTDGKILLAGEQWDATSRTIISAGQRVRVVRTILEVEKE